MSSHISWIVLAGLISGCSTSATSIADLERPASGECISGNCTNGYGTLRFPDGGEITGNRVNDHLVAGNYEFRYPCRPDKTFTVTLDNAGHPVSGTVVRCGDLLGALESGARTTYYSGTFQTISNPFTHEQTATYRTGTYTDGNGVNWEGEFDYIPVKHTVDSAQLGKVAHRKGSFIFMGAKVDSQLNEVVRGLFISEPVSPGSEINFAKARPDYLVKLRSTFVAESEHDAAEREADARASRELFSNIVTFASATVVAYGTYKMAETASNRTTMDSLNNVLTGQKSPTVANAELPRSNKGNAGTSPQPLTVAEYRSLQRTSSPSTSNAVDRGSSYASNNYSGANIDRGSSASESSTQNTSTSTSNTDYVFTEWFDVYSSHVDFDGIGNGQARACEKGKARISRDAGLAPDQRTTYKTQSVGSCRCEMDKTSSYKKKEVWECYTEYVREVHTYFNNPNRAEQGRRKRPFSTADDRIYGSEVPATDP